MTETSVGLFERTEVANSVADALRAHGFPPNGIRIVSKPVDMPVQSPTSTPAVDFAARIAEDLRSMGATDSESHAYLAGVRRGNALVFATGSHSQAETAIGVMNAYHPVVLDEFAGAAPPAAPGIQGKEIEPHDPISLKSGQARAKTEGARVFSW